MDIVQASYVTAYTQLDKLRDTHTFAAWVSRIVSNEALGHLRKQVRNKELSETTMHLLNSANTSEDSPQTKLANQQLRATLEQSIDLLPLEYRSVFMLRGIQQLSTEETALSLDLNIDVVKTRFSRAKRKLRGILNKKITNAGLNVHEFAGWQCDQIVKKVMAKIS